MDGVKIYFDHGFGNSVASVANQRVLQEELVALAKQTGLAKPPPRKLGPQLRDYLSEVRKLIEQAQEGHRCVTLDQIVRDIAAFPVLDRLLESCLEEWIPSAIDPLRTVADYALVVFELCFNQKRIFPVEGRHI